MTVLQVHGTHIVDATGQPVQLRGTSIGGWMNLENFINGYPGAGESLRRVMAETLGETKTAFFFERLLHHFVQRADIAFIRDVGANVIRLPLNYRHFEDDAHPFSYHPEGFALLDQMVNWCGEYGISVILDLHAVQGWQNTDWHSDNANRHALLWTHPHFQDRFVALWEVLAGHYVGNPVIAGYNLMNEPVSNAPFGLFPFDYQPDYGALNALYRRAVTAIRAIDPDHIIFLEGDRFSRLFAGLDAPFAPNLVYSSHNYTAEGFGPGPYPGTDENTAAQAAEFVGGEWFAFTQQHSVPLWVGEFGIPYNGVPSEMPDRLRALSDQIGILEAHSAHWTTWTYKDVGVMGWVHPDPESPYLRTIAPLLEAKGRLSADFWMQWLPSTRASHLVDDLAEEIAQAAAVRLDARKHHNYLRQVALEIYAGGVLQRNYAEQFAALSEDEIDHLLQSFTFGQCVPRLDLVTVMRQTLRHH